LLSPAMKLLLTRLQLHVVQRMQNVDKGNAPLKHPIRELDERIGKGERFDVLNPFTLIHYVVNSNDFRFLLEALHGQVSGAAYEGFLLTCEAKH
ncbi:hypothetical protein VSS93_28750, partial [Pseudomonas syringae pv. tagetis]